MERKRRMQSTRATGLCLLLASAAAQVAGAQTIQGGEVNISGATLFLNFFTAPASTNDFIDVDGDGFAGYHPGTPPFVDQVAPTYTCSGWSGWWLLQYRGVGSVEGFGEFIDNQLLGTIPSLVPSENGLINRVPFATTGVPSNPCSSCNPHGLEESCCDSGTPYCPSSIDLAVLDVPTSWAVRTGAVDDAAWNRRPGQIGYGWNAILSWDTGFESRLESLAREGAGTLNTNTNNPDDDTLFDSQIAWVPITPIANRGAGLQDVTVTDLQHLFVSGRRANGENLVAATRDVGSGTRNGMMNTLGIDPAAGRGDNYGDRNTIAAVTNLGPTHQATNCGGSSVIEEAVQKRRLAVGYTGLAGSSRAAGDANAGRYEILNVILDDRGGSTAVRPTIDAVLDNCDPDSGYPLGGAETFVSRGDPFELDSGLPAYMEAEAAADYLRNVVESTVAFEEQPGATPTEFMPGRYLADTYFLLAGVDCLPDTLEPTVLVANAELNGELQEYIRDHNGLGIGGDTPDYGVTVANKVPTRAGNPSWSTSLRPAPVYTPWPWPAVAQPPVPPYTGAVPADGQYGDGSTNGNYADLSGAFTVAAGVNLSERNQIMGDFNNDKARDLNDIAGLASAMYDPRAFAAAEGVVPGNPGALGTNYVIPELIGDFNGDGNFGKIVAPSGGGGAAIWDTQDARYFADGLAIDPATGKLDRKQGFTLLDQAWSTVGGDLNLFGTTLSTGAAYAAGASRADVAGALPAPGANPSGHDGLVDCQDVAYVCENFGDWSQMDDAQSIDLSCDMNGDLLVDQADVTEIVVVILAAPGGDVNLDGVRDAADVAIVQAHLGQPGCYCDGDLDGDGVVDAQDLALAQGQEAVIGDSNCDGVVNAFDIDPFVLALSDQAGWEASYDCDYLAANDTNQDGAVNVFDIDPFVALLSGGPR